MSTSCQSKTVKPVNLEDQPIISQFIVDSAISPASPKSAKNQETKNKKCRRSTGNCRALKTKGMVFRYTWVYSKEDTMAHTRRLVVTS